MGGKTDDQLSGGGGGPSAEQSKMFLNLDGSKPGVDAEPPSLDASASKAKMNHQTMLAIVVLLVAGGAIYGMRFVGMRGGINTKTVSIDYEPGSVEQDVKRFDDLLRRLELSARPVQVTEVRLNPSPFTYDAPEPDEIAPLAAVPGESPEELARREAERRRLLAIERERKEAAARSEELESVVHDLTLQSVVGGRRPAARVSGEGVRVGDTCAGLFRVTEITGRSVILEADGRTWELAIGQPAVEITGTR